MATREVTSNKEKGFFWKLRQLAKKFMSRKNDKFTQSYKNKVH